MKMNKIFSALSSVETNVLYAALSIVIVLLLLVVIVYLAKIKALVSENKKIAAAPTTGAIQNTNDEEIVAVITAAIAAMLGESTNGFRIHSYRVVQGNEWNKAGRREVLDKRF